MENQPVVRKGSIVSAMFLVAGTCIGGGMLALPVATGLSGFMPSILIMIVCWLAMTTTALLLLEVSMWMEEGVHLISMTSRILGTPGKIVSWCLYLFICYASLVAYTAGGGVQVSTAVRDYFGILISKEIGSVLFIFVFGAIIYLGSRVVGRVNAVLFMAMVGAYLGLIGIGLPETKLELLKHRQWSGSLMSVPLLLTAFSFQTMVPSLTPYLKRNAKALRIAVLGGTITAFVIYAIWQWLILGIVPIEGSNGLSEALARGEPATQFLREHVQGSMLCVIAEYFAFFAIVTSFLGIALGLFDFLSDGLKIKKAGNGKLILGLLIIVPTIVFATQFERVFLVALETSGGFGDTILNGLIPVLMVWLGRYYLKMGKEGGFTVPGGKPLLALIFTFFFCALCLEILVQTGVMAGIYKPFELPIEYMIPEIAQ
ncbi:MAG: amino acid transporter [Parachlamydiaceae bacterium]|nr:amino acid transporter [Parachlamydiaceae bacterium]